MELKLKIEDIDYESAVDLLAPLLIEYLRKEGGNPLLAKMLSGSPEMAKSAVKTILAHMPREKKDAMLVRLLNDNRAAICKAIEAFAASKKLHFRIMDAKASSE